MILNFYSVIIQILRDQPSSLSCDVYSYGMVLYEIFARKLPFDDIKTDYFNLLMKKGNGEVIFCYCDNCIILSYVPCILLVIRYRPSLMVLKLILLV